MVPNYMPKILIQKKMMLNNLGHFRYYSPYYDRDLHRHLPRKKRPKSPLIDLSAYPQIKTERHLCKWIYDLFGEGEYLVFGFVKGRRGLWTFWKGLINKDGFCFRNKAPSNKKDIEKLKNELAAAADEEERQFIIEELELEKECAQSENTKYGFVPYLQVSSRRGLHTLWEEPELPNNHQVEEESWGSVNKEPDKFEKWDESKIDKPEKFDKW